MSTHYSSQRVWIGRFDGLIGTTHDCKGSETDLGSCSLFLEEQCGVKDLGLV